MKKIIAIITVYAFFSVYAMEQKSYLDSLPPELRKLLMQFAIDLEKISTLDQLLLQLKNLSQVKQLGWAKTVHGSLQQIKNATSYGDALKVIKELSQNKELTFLFNSADFTHILILELKGKTKAPVQLENIAQDFLRTPGALKWLAKRPQELKLIEAAERGIVKEVDSLIKAGVNINAKSNEGDTALHKAVDNEHKEVVALLLDKGADINAKDRNGTTALLSAAHEGNKDIVELLIAKGADVNIQNNLGDTALINASKEGSKEVVKLLLNAGANVNVQNLQDMTALMWAAGYDRKDVIELLKRHGAKE